jgi:parvulin-like peptidyl-prolyl isomerase
MNIQKTVPIIIVGIVIIAGAWYFMSSSEPLSNEPANTEGAAAIVNGEEIARTQFETFKSQVIAQQGLDAAALDRDAENQLETQIVDELISQTLLRQAVDASGVVATQEDVDAQIEATAIQLGGEEAFNEALVAEGLSEEEFRTQISAELAVQMYLEQELSLSSITVTDEEVEAAYVQASAQSENVPPLEDVRPQIEQSIIQQKQQPLLAELIDRLRTEADIEILL